MDIQEIQRLHAQFAPDSMVIDLPRQLAALPAPGDLTADECADEARQVGSGGSARSRQRHCGSGRRAGWHGRHGRRVAVQDAPRR